MSQLLSMWAKSPKGAAGRGVVLLAALLATTVHAAGDYPKYSEEALRAALAERALLEKKILVPMRDGVGLSTDVYRPRNVHGVLPTVFIRTPYSFNELENSSLRLGVEAVSRGYALVTQTERGRYFSEGEFELFGYLRTDGYHALSWIADQEWSNGKVGTLGCSSSAEWQLALAGQAHVAHAAMVPMAAGAGIGRVGPFQKRGNWYTGGVPRMLFFVWLRHVDNPLLAQIPRGLDSNTRARIARYNDLAAHKPEVDWKKHFHHLPIAELLSALDEPSASFERFIARKPNDPAWFEGGLYHDNEPWDVLALWFNSWYDVSIGPNMALYREGYDWEVMMREGKVYRLVFIPMTTIIEFQKGHRIRVEVTSSNFPKFARNLNTGGNNFDEAEVVTAHNSVSHSASHQSYEVLPVVGLHPP